MNPNKIKHLEFIQTVITRMNSNSFLLKGWCVTLVSALTGLGGRGSDTGFGLVAFSVIPIFWGLDAFYLFQEIKYRALYEQIRLKPESEIDFDMDPSRLPEKGRDWIDVIFSKTLFTFYCATIGAAGLVVFLL